MSNDKRIIAIETNAYINTVNQVVGTQFNHISPSVNLLELFELRLKIYKYVDELPNNLITRIEQVFSFIPLESYVEKMLRKTTKPV
jgi:hypothetical protein